jgi:hypothetical protein
VTVGASILPIGIGLQSDHRFLYANISLATLCHIPSQSLHNPTHPASHNLWSTDVKAAEKYVEHVTIGFEHANINARTAILINGCERMKRCTPNDES